jgi:hypothetical protein
MEVYGIHLFKCCMKYLWICIGKQKWGYQYNKKPWQGLDILVFILWTKMYKS